MTLHELATNAVKYGALSSNSGQLGISWKTARGGRLMLTWEERATLNPVPTRRGGGFGMQLIDKASATISAAKPRSSSGRPASMWN